MEEVTLEPLRLTKMEITNFRLIKHAVIFLDGNLVAFGENKERVSALLNAMAFPFKPLSSTSVRDFHASAGPRGKRQASIEATFKRGDGETLKLRLRLLEEGKRVVREVQEGEVWKEVEKFPPELPEFAWMPHDNSLPYAKLSSKIQAGAQGGKGVLLFMQTPEIHLNAQELKQLAANLKKAQSQGFQIVTTSFDPTLIDWSGFRPVVRVEGANGSITLKQTQLFLGARDHKELQKVASQFPDMISAMLRAKRVLIIEGNTEKEAWPILARTLKMPTKGVELLMANGIGGILQLVKVAELLGAKYVAVHDSDGIEREYIERNRAIRKQVRNGALVVFKKDFEAAAQLETNGKNKPSKARRWATKITAQRMPSGIREAIRISYGEFEPGLVANLA